MTEQLFPDEIEVLDYETRPRPCRVVKVELAKAAAIIDLVGNKSYCKMKGGELQMKNFGQWVALRDGDWILHQHGTWRHGDDEWLEYGYRPRGES